MGALAASAFLVSSPSAHASVYLGGELKWGNRADDGSSELLNVLWAMNFGTKHGEKDYNESYRDDTQENGFDLAKARAYALRLINENKNDCINDRLQECSCLCYNALYLAIEVGDVEIARRLIEQGCSIELDNICTNDFYFRRDIIRNENPKVQEAYALLLDAQVKAGIAPFSPEGKVEEVVPAPKANEPVEVKEESPAWLINDPADAPSS